jgi:hypothetical protein
MLSSMAQLHSETDGNSSGHRHEHLCRRGDADSNPFEVTSNSLSVSVHFTIARLAGGSRPPALRGLPD